FSQMLKKRGGAKIKPLLMDQSFVSGIGNIYADESLHFAGILPIRPAGKIKSEEIKKIYSGIKTILKKSIAQGGTSSDTYVTLSGQKGGYEKYLKVYGREGKKCRRCKETIKRVKLGGRSAHFCPRCQR
ncbi:MAG TPA: zinc finger domain-containing protein, partial [Patescibacteria group bacterium]|nr:zinc finger domain-containing protein [Patescibacteria group bacterium]